MTTNTKLKVNSDMGVVSQAEVETLILSFLASRNKEFGKEDSISEKEIMKIVEWAEHARVDNAMLDNVLNGTILINLNKSGGICFGVTPKGKTVVENMNVKAGGN